MNESANAKPDASNNQPEQPKAHFKICRECCANLPSSSYGFYKYTRDRLTQVCKECRSQTQRIKRKLKYGTIGLFDGEPIRNVSLQNDHIINQALSDLTCVAFNTATKEDYKVVFAKDSKTDLKSMTIIKMDGSVLHEYLYSGVKDVKPILMNLLKQLNLRLELSEAYMMASKNVIYYV